MLHMQENWPVIMHNSQQVDWLYFNLVHNECQLSAFKGFFIAFEHSKVHRMFPIIQFCIFLSVLVRHGANYFAKYLSKVQVL